MAGFPPGPVEEPADCLRTAGVVALPLRGRVQPVGAGRAGEGPDPPRGQRGSAAVTTRRERRGPSVPVTANSRVPSGDQASPLGRR